MLILVMIYLGVVVPGSGLLSVPFVVPSRRLVPGRLSLLLSFLGGPLLYLLVVIVVLPAHVGQNIIWAETSRRPCCSCGSRRFYLQLWSLASCSCSYAGPGSLKL